MPENNLFPQLVLHRYGFASARAGTTTSAALVNFQRFYGLDPSGVLDEATVNLMEQPRCAMSDVESDLAATAIGGWNKRRLRYHLDSFFTDGSIRQIDRVVESAFATWSIADPHRLTFDRTADRSTADIVLAMRTASDADFDLSGKNVAHADYPPGYSRISRTPPLPLHVDNSEPWGLGAADKYDLLTVLIHEIGHTLGLVHVGDPNAVMYSFTPKGRMVHSLQAPDVNQLRVLYP